MRATVAFFACSAFLVGCAATPIPEPPVQFDTVVVTSDLPATRLYADAVAAFSTANWTLISGAEGELTTFIRPDGVRPNATQAEGLDSLTLRVRVAPLSPDADTTIVPDLADADYAGPDLSNRDLSDPARGQNEPDSLRRAALPDPLTTGSAVLTARIGADGAEARDVLIRTARILAGLDGTISYR